MASVVQEPVTKGRVVVHTDRGPIEIELWPREAPLTCRNFVALVMKGAYNGSTFDRLVPRWIIQNDGSSSGSSADGRRLPPEPHQRLRFVRRGLVAMADSHSRFFITLARTDGLHGKHTIFGRVAGDTIFNVLEMADQDVDSDERPRNPPRVTHVEVAENPFPDLLPESSTDTHKKGLEKHLSPAESQKKQATSIPQQKTASATRSRPRASLLSFTNAEEDQDSSASQIIPILKTTQLKDRRKKEQKGTLCESNESGKEKMPEPVSSEEITVCETLIIAKSSSQTACSEDKSVKTVCLKNSIQADTEKHPDHRNNIGASLLNKEREKYVSKLRALNLENEDTMFDALAKFKTRLTQHPEKLQEKPESTEKNSVTNNQACLLHSIPGCLSCFDVTEQKDDGIDESGWMTREVRFSDLSKRFATLEESDAYSVIDPRTSLCEIRKKRARRDS